MALKVLIKSLKLNFKLKTLEVWKLYTPVVLCIPNPPSPYFWQSLNLHLHHPKCIQKRVYFFLVFLAKVSIYSWPGLLLRPISAFSWPFCAPFFEIFQRKQVFEILCLTFMAWATKHFTQKNIFVCTSLQNSLVISRTKNQVKCM